MIQETNFIKLQKALLGDERFLIKLRMLEGFDEKKFFEVCEALREFVIECKNRERLPKRDDGSIRVMY